MSETESSFEYMANYVINHSPKNTYVVDGEVYYVIFTVVKGEVTSLKFKPCNRGQEFVIDRDFPGEITVDANTFTLKYGPTEYKYIAVYEQADFGKISGPYGELDLDELYKLQLALEDNIVYLEGHENWGYDKLIDYHGRHISMIWADTVVEFDKDSMSWVDHEFGDKITVRLLKPRLIWMPEG